MKSTPKVFKELNALVAVIPVKNNIKGDPPPECDTASPNHKLACKG